MTAFDARATGLWRAAASSVQWSLFRAYARPERRRLTVLGTLLLGATLLQVGAPQIVRHYMDGVAGGLIEPLVMLAVAYLATAFVLQALRITATYVGEKAAWTMTNLVRLDLTRHCLSQDIRFQRDHTPGELIERVDGDVTSLANFLSNAFLLILSNALLLLGVFVSLFLTDWRIGLTLLLYAICAIAVLSRVRDIAVGSWVKAREASTELYGYVEERLASTEEIRSNAAEGHVLARLSGLGGDVLTWQRRARMRSNSIFLSLHGLYLLGYGAALAVGAYLFTNGEATIGTVYLVVAYTNAIYTPLNEVRVQIQDLQQANAGVRRVAELFSLRPSVTDGPGEKPPEGALAVRFDGVSFAYDPDAPPALHDVSFHLEPGAVLGVVGRTGSGKTTLARLLSRMYDATEGSVRVGGVDVRRMALADLRDRIGIVTQDTQLFEGTLRDNLTLFDESIGDEEILGAADRLGIRQWLERLPGGLDTRIESGGRGLSAGEAQFVALCRIMLRDPSVIVLDEASARLDAATEHLLQEALAAVHHGRTVIVIAHRLATLAHVDQVMVLEDGRVVEFGPRDTLMADPGSRLRRLARDPAQELL
ncbi:ABC transporter ATP-binding protein [Nonomuraea sp. NPDC049400]|uniref:ABC transporter ATP-binding protein n=1 Tax=Nonomuraea sp. NPDC049400 TaxID=3364352 RepID=UPI0037A37E2F